MGGIGEGEPAGEDPAVASGELAAVEGDGDDLGLGGADLDPPADQARIERVVVAVEAQVGLGRDPQDPAPVG